MIRTKVACADGRVANVERLKRDHKDKNGLVTLTEPLIQFRSEFKPFLNATYGINMAQNAAVGGTPDKIHDGTDSVLWTGSGTNFTFDSTAQAFAGSKSVDATASLGGDIATFTRGSAIDSSGYVAITGAIYITGWPTSGTKDVTLTWALAGSSQSGTVNISNYIDDTVFNSWQQFSIALTDFVFTGASVDELLVETIDLGGGAPPDYYLDAIQLEETGGPIEFRSGHELGEVFHAHKLRLTFVDNVTGITTVAGATETTAVPNLSYNTWLGVATLVNGIGLTYDIGGEQQFSTQFRQLSDLVFAGGDIVVHVSDGTNTMMAIEVTFPEPIVFTGSTDANHMAITINDNMSTLLLFRAALRGSIEI